MKHRLVLAACFTLLGAHPVQACYDDIDNSDFARAVDALSPDANRAVIPLCGYTLEIVSGVTIAQGGLLNDISFTINGVPVRFITDAPDWDSFQDSGSSNDSITVIVNGRTLYSGFAKDLSIQAALDFLAALGLADPGTVAQQDVQRSSARVVANVISKRVSAVLSGMTVKSEVPNQKISSSRQGRGDAALAGLKSTGISAGDPGHARGVWVTGGQTWVKNSDDFSPFRGDTQLALMGVDFQPTAQSVLGAAVGFENTDVETEFNRATLLSQGFTFTPYFAVKFLDDRLTWSLLGSYGLSDNDTTRHTFQTDAKVSGHYDSRRWSASSEVQAYQPLPDGMTLNGSLGALALWDHRDRYTESDGTHPFKNDTVLGEGKAGVKLFFDQQGIFRAYGGADYLYDFIMDQDIDRETNQEDRDEWMAILGADFELGEHAFNVEVNHSLGRESYEETSVSGNYRWQF